MWQTVMGDRILEGDEAQLFAEIALDFTQTLEACENEYDLNIPVFDSLTYNQKIWVLLVIVKGLLQQKFPAVELTAVNEGAIAAIFEHLKAQVCCEIDMKLPSNWRILIREALVYAGFKGMPRLRSRKTGEWEFAIDRLSGRVLWDSDYLAAYTLDTAPENASLIKAAMGINDEYFMDTPHDPDDMQTRKNYVALKTICLAAMKRYKK